MGFFRRHNPPMTDLLSPTNIASIERATLDAVAPRVVDDTLPGWLLPFDATTIGRAKSAVPLRHEGLSADDIAHIAERYRLHCLQPAWRMADVAGLQPLLDALHQQGYTPQQPTLVQTGKTGTLAGARCRHTVVLRTEPDAAWRSVYTAPGFDPADGEARIAALSRSKVVMYATVLEGDQACAAGTASFSRGWMGIHGMRTVLARRQRGMACAILSALAQEGLRRGIRDTFLQVEAENTGARTLYAKHGLSTAWTYHYWRA
ncbi:MAG: GNAT family N-acetyltransferase [Betaproteobacteria bacterium]|nr:GNAT family N-acetyltransferase [Betaproteobacteria bacterium]